MSNFPRDEQMAADYLLGNLPESQADHLDELSVVDDEFAQFLGQVENDLIDDYVRDELPKDQRARFESHYLASAERRKRVELARTFVQRIDRVEPAHARNPSPVTRPRFLTLAAMAAVLLLTMIGVYFALRNQHLKKDVVQPAKIEAPKTNESPKQFAFILSPQYRGNVSIPKVKIPQGTDSIVVTLKMESDDFASYEAVLKESSTGKIIWRSNQEKANQQAVIVTIPAHILGSQDYILEVSGITATKTQFIGGYPFQVL